MGNGCIIDFRCLFNVHGRFTGFSGYLGKALCISGKFSPHNNDGIMGNRHFPDLILPFFRGIADGIKNFVMGGIGPAPLFDLRKNLGVLRGLGH